MNFKKNKFEMEMRAGKPAKQAVCLLTFTEGKKVKSPGDFSPKLCPEIAASEAQGKTKFKWQFAGHIALAICAAAFGDTIPIAIGIGSRKCNSRTICK